MLAHHFRSSVSLWLDMSRVRPVHATRAGVPVVSGELGKLLNHGPPLGEESGTSPYECTAAAVTCRLNASAESLSGMQLYKRNDETDFLSWLEVSGCDPCVITSIVEPFLFPVVCV